MHPGPRIDHKILEKVGRQMLQASGTAGLYEVLEYESTLDLKDRQGERATFKKRSRKSPKP